MGKYVGQIFGFNFPCNGYNFFPESRNSANAYEISILEKLFATVAIHELF